MLAVRESGRGSSWQGRVVDSEKIRPGEKLARKRSRQCENPAGGVVGKEEKLAGGRYVGRRKRIRPGKEVKDKSWIPDSSNWKIEKQI